MAFWSHNRLKIDEKGRVSLPTNYREEFKDEGGFVVWLGKHIGIMPSSAWTRYFKSMERNPALKPIDLRVLASWATPFKLDPQGRLVISQPLRERAGLDGHVELVGSGHYIAVYTPEDWDAIEAERADPRVSSLLDVIEDSW